MLSQTIADDDVKQLISVINAAFGIRHDQAVRVTVQSETDIAAHLRYALRECLRMRRAAALVNVETIRMIEFARDLGTEFVEHRRATL